MFANYSVQHAITAEHRKAVNDFAAFRWIVVHETNRSTIEFAIVDEFAQQQLAGISSAINQRAPSGLDLAAGQELPEETKSHPAARQQHQHHQTINHKDNARETLKPKLEEDDNHADDRSGCDCLRERHQVVDARVAPDAPIHAKQE